MLIELLFPNRCIECQALISKKMTLCEHCRSQLSFTHQRFDNNNLLYQRAMLRFPLEQAYALFKYEKNTVTQRLIHHLKYKSMPRIGAFLGEMIAEQLNSPNMDALVTIPLHPKKEKERGYNQLHLLAETLSESWGIPHYPHYLKRNFYSKPQAKKDKAHRAYDKAIFSLNQREEVGHILLIDDVFTTGNTMADAAWCLLSQENIKLSTLVLAIDV